MKKSILFIVLHYAERIFKKKGPLIACSNRLYQHFIGVCQQLGYFNQGKNISSLKTRNVLKEKSTPKLLGEDFAH